MTDRYGALTVILDRDIREDDAEHLMNAIRMMRGVAEVKGEITENLATAIERSRLTRQLTEKLYGVIKDLCEGK